jgi:Protein of unknown function (DUF541)
MSESPLPRSTVSTDATVVMRQRPAVLLMIARVRAAEATLDLGLAEVHRQSADTVRRLTRLGAEQAWAGDPHPDDQADPDPVARMRAVAARIRPPTAALADRPGVNIAVAATWNVSELSSEGVLALVDRLGFDSAADTKVPDPPDAPLPWADPTEVFQQMMTRAADPPDDRSPKFLYIVRPTEEQLAQATAEAYRAARRQAERLAGAAGLRVGAVSSLSYSYAGAGGRPDLLLAHQRCAALLAAVGYTLGDGEVASEDPRAAEVRVSVLAVHHLQV